ncbi:MAG TPA: hypothetical protein VM715_15670 [Candidatus Acidoferrum sp.]|nr:hypothetical protein [Candidatus Acidoferrum sp.]
MDINKIVDEIVSHVLALGTFERVNSHEPKNSPGNGLSCAIWADSVKAVPAASGLASSAAQVVMNMRLYTSMLQQPYDDIDPNLMTVLDVLMAEFSGDFELGGAVRNVDLLGEHGTSFGAQAGYLNIDNKIYRVMTLTVPLIINDAWNQVA